MPVVDDGVDANRRDGWGREKETGVERDDEMREREERQKERQKERETKSEGRVREAGVVSSGRRRGRGDSSMTRGVGMEGRRSKEEGDSVVAMDGLV